MMVCMARSLVEVELLLVPDCAHAQPAEESLGSALRAAGLGSTPIRVSVIDSQRAAELRGFVGSPTILINGHDRARPTRPATCADLPRLSRRIRFGRATPGRATTRRACRRGLHHPAPDTQ